MITQKDLVLLPFPFSDQTGRKVRPAIVISNDEFNNNSEDVLVVAVTSNISKGKYTIPLTNKDLEEGKLNVPCCIKVENILKIEKSMIIKKIGKIKGYKLEFIRKIIFDIIR
ncbi:MAG: mRNA interferase MazF [Candidatus Woesearchaeota archaeon]|nr:mRNA interferase MazF [Candidatus Woesearchaeota archaeon]